MRLWTVLPFLLFGYALTQPNIGTHLDGSDLRSLEELVVLALENDPEVIAATVALPLPLGEVLAIDVGAGLHGDRYGQVEPSVSLSVRLDVVALLDREERVRRAALRQAEGRVRVRVVEAFVRHRVALERAAAAALALEAAHEYLRAAEIRYGAGRAIPADVFDARDRVAATATRLLEGNAEIVVALETLAAVVGVEAARVREALP